MSDLNIDYDGPPPDDGPKIGNLGGESGPPGFFAPGWHKRILAAMGRSWLYRVVGSFLLMCLFSPDKIWRFVVYLCTFVVSVAGPEAKELGAKITGAIHGTEKQIPRQEERRVRDEQPPQGNDPKPGFLGRKVEDAKEKAKIAATGVVVEQAKEKVEDAKEAVVEKTQEAKQTVVDAKEKVEKKADDVVGALKQKVQDRREAEHRPQDFIAIPRQPAPFRGFMPNVQVVKARCPRCGIAIDLPDSARKPRGCTNCLSTYYPADARAAAKQGRRY